MRGFKKCHKCGDPDFTTAPRTGFGRFVLLCAPCNVDARTSSTRKLTVEDVKTYNDRYAQLAVKHGVA